ncbi:MAG: HNH endonuclease [Actinomycetia bacterium]|nr:HNH endonuclease [Actinomycetes bacterium]
MDSSTSGSSAVSVAEQVDRLLDAATPAAGLGDDALRDELIACERAAQMLLARQAQMMVQMGLRARAADQAEVVERGAPMWSRECREEFVPDEIAVLLACTKVAASNRYGTACGAADFPVVGKAWRAGQIDARKVTLIGEQVSLLDSGTAHTVAADAIEYGQARTAPQLREWLRRKVIAADPGAAEQRRQRAVADRRVVITAGDDGMCELWALLPGVQGRQIQQTLTAAAQQLGAGDGSAGDAHTMDQRRADTLVDLLLGRTEPPAVNVQVIVPVDTITGACDQPGWVPGHGPVTATEIDELVRPRTGDGTGDGTGGGSDGAEGEVSGIGTQVTFRRLLTDPATGTLTDLAEKGYRPSAALDRAVRARDVTCRFPGCRRSADTSGTDLDHTVPYPVGPTSAANLAVLCRRHHRLKHTAGWTVTLDPTGAMTWTTPTGRQYDTHPWHYTDPDPPPDG